MRALAALLLIMPIVGGCTAATSETPVDRTTSPAQLSTASQAPQTSSAPPKDTTKPFDRTRHSLTDPRSIWVIVNKKHPISPLDYEPHLTIVRGYQVARPAAPSLAQLLRAAGRVGVQLKIASAYRSYGYQEGVHAHLEATVGLRAADAISARAGYSEHQTGLAVDLQPLDGTCALQPCFAQTHAGRWLDSHAWRYGFIVRYTTANSDITGYSPEPWHFRYVGASLARELHSTGVGSLEEFFDVRGGNYKSP